jgi:hypothetical protein
MTTVRFTDLPDGEWTTVAFPYDPACISIIKGLSGGYRSYDPKTKTWRVLTEMADRLADEFISSGHQVEGEAITPPPVVQDLNGFFGIDATSDGFDPKQAARDFIASLPGQHVHKTFRMMARELYPDLYGRKA